MKSMTGYGAAEGAVGQGAVFIEIRAVNHRYNDIILKMPPKLNVLEGKFRKLIQGVVARGKVELFLKEREEWAPMPRVTVNRPLVKAYARCLRNLERELGATKHDLLDVVDLKELMRVEEPVVNFVRLWGALQRVGRTALARFEAMRRAEGAHLQRDQRQRLRRLLQLVTQIQRRTLQNQRVLQQQWATDPNRGAGEGHPGVDRMDITEELVRLQSHGEQYRQFLTAREPVGRQLDFLLQEMNREVNTMASKASDAQISQLVVHAKSELEKLREQAQNIE